MKRKRKQETKGRKRGKRKRKRNADIKGGEERKNETWERNRDDKVKMKTTRMNGIIKGNL